MKSNLDKNFEDINHKINIMLQRYIIISFIVSISVGVLVELVQEII